jgi:hypothetical protein
MDSNAATPEFLILQRTDIQSLKDDHKSDNNSSINNTVSFCSNFSRIPVDRVLYRDVLRKRKEHKIFLELESEECYADKIWYYIDDKDSKIIGPLTPIEMNERFELEAFKETTKMKRKYEEDYYKLSILVTRYIKNVLSEKLDLHKEPAPLSNKVSRFRKGEAMIKHKKEKEVFEHKHREERFFSQAVKPNLLDLKRLMPVDPDQEESEFSRMRANTEAQRFNHS